VVDVRHDAEIPDALLSHGGEYKTAGTPVTALSSAP
jgi:hypothetical protein